MDPASRGQRSYLAFGCIEQPDIAYKWEEREGRQRKCIAQGAYLTVRSVGCVS